MSAPKLRILCLHGYGGSGMTMESQMSRLYQAMEPYSELVCIDAPSLNEGDYGWWHARDVPTGRFGTEMRYVGWERTRAGIVEAFEKHGPFQGVFGMSQGAALTGILVGLRAPDGKPTEEHPLVFDFAVMVGGFESRDLTLAKVYDDAACYSAPSVHIVGRMDGIVPPARSLLLASKFDNPTILWHDAGHIIASTPSVKQGMAEFLAERQKEYAARLEAHKTAVVSEVPGHGEVTEAATEAPTTSVQA